jgi:prolyl-tRNA synthetase
MLLSRLLGKTLRQPPSEAQLKSHQLLVRAGYLRGLGPGTFGYLPLGTRTLGRLQALVERHLSILNAQQVHLPELPDARPVDTLVRLVRREVDSYRQLPCLLYQIDSLVAEQPRVREGLFGAAQRPTAQVHAFGGAGLTAAGAGVREVLDRLLAECGLPAVWAEAGLGIRRAYYDHAFGDEQVARCLDCDYAAERSWAMTSWPDPADEAELLPEEIATPGCNTIAGLAEFLQIPESQTLKMVFYSVAGRVTCVVIRGDRGVDEDKLARLLGTTEYYASLEDELADIGAVGGYASPIGLDQSLVQVVADPSVRSGKNFVSGANRADYHIRNVNLPRDFAPGQWVDLALVQAGDPCPICGAALEIEPAFALLQEAAPVPCTPAAEYLDKEGRGQALSMASWRLDLARFLAAIVEEQHDDYGIIWPAACAPYDVHLVVLDTRKEAVASQAQALVQRLQAEGWAVLHDDRDASAGVKFNDADLIGIPLRLTVSKRSAKEGLVEAKWRDSKERLNLDESGLAAELARLRQV